MCALPYTGVKEAEPSELSTLKANDTVVPLHTAYTCECTLVVISKFLERLAFLQAHASVLFHTLSPDSSLKSSSDPNLRILSSSLFVSEGALEDPLPPGGDWLFRWSWLLKTLLSTCVDTVTGSATTSCMVKAERRRRKMRRKRRRMMRRKRRRMMQSHPVAYYREATSILFLLALSVILSSTDPRVKNQGCMWVTHTQNCCACGCVDFPVSILQNIIVMMLPYIILVLHRDILIL